MPFPRSPGPAKPFRLQRFRRRWQRCLRRMSLRSALLVPVVVGVAGTVGTMGYLSVRNGQAAIDTLAEGLMAATGDRVERAVRLYCSVPYLRLRSTLAAQRAGLLDFDDLPALERYFWEQLGETAPAGTTLLYGNPQGEFVAVRQETDGAIAIVRDEATAPYREIWALDATGQRDRRVESGKTYDPRFRPWYAIAAPAGTPWDNPEAAIGEPSVRWTAAFESAAEPDRLVVSAVLPVFAGGAGEPGGDGAGEFQGVLGASLTLDQLDRFLRDPRLQPGPGGVAFVMDGSGHLIASSADEEPWLWVDGRPRRLHSTRSSSELLQAAARTIAPLLEAGGPAALGGEANPAIAPRRPLGFAWDGRDYLLYASPVAQPQDLPAVPWLEDLDWVAVVAMPRAAFSAELRRNLRAAIALSVLAFAIAAGLGTVAVQRLVRPLRQLDRAARALQQGDWTHPVGRGPTREVWVLGQTFERMRRQLLRSRRTLEAYARELEQRVADRTRDLEAEVRERERAQDAAEAANRAKSEFLANMSHELRTPLNAILGFGQLLAADAKLAAAHRELGIIQRSGEHLLELIDDVLEMSKIEAGRTVLAPTPVDLHGLLQELEGLFALRARDRGLSWDVAIAPDFPRYAIADASKLRQVLTNLLGNALKFAERGGVVLRAMRADSADRNPAAFQDFENPQNSQNSETPEGATQARPAGWVEARNPTPTPSDPKPALSFAAIAPPAETENSGNTQNSNNPKNPEPAQNPENAENLENPENAGNSSNSGNLETSKNSGDSNNSENPQTLGNSGNPRPADKPGEILHLRFEVEDTGPGIAPEDLDRIFAPFVQSTTGQRSRQGTGLGLAIARQFVQLMGGTLTVRSAVGRGSCFAFDLRAGVPAPAELATLAPAPRAIGLAPGQPRYRFLVTDDDPDSRLLLVRLLRSLGFETLEAADGEAAIAQWQQGAPDLIWLDLRMPKLNGIETVRRLRALEPPGQHVPVVALTASALAAERAAMLAAGCDDFIGKPYRTEAIWAAIARHLDAEFVYETPRDLPESPASPTAGDRADRDRAAPLTPELRETLPADWRDRLRQAAISGDDTAAAALVAELPPARADLARYLASLLEDFRLDAIADWLEPGG